LSRMGLITVDGNHQPLDPAFHGVDLVAAAGAATGKPWAVAKKAVSRDWGRRRRRKGARGPGEGVFL
jgi:hypothetical protein